MNINLDREKLSLASGEVEIQQRLKPLLKKLEGKKIFITGATGFFGKSLLDFLMLNPDQEVTILSRNPNSFFTHWPQYKSMRNLKFIAGDVSHFEFPREKYDYLLHMATSVSTAIHSQDPEVMKKTILEGTKRALELTVRCEIPDVLFASSGAIYGRQLGDMEKIPENYTESTSPEFRGNVYGESKRLAEILGFEHAQQHRYNFKSARCFAFVGPHLDPNAHFVIANFIRDALMKKDLNVTGDGTPLRSYLYSDDLIVWLLTMLIDGRPGEAVNVGSDEAISILDLAKKIKEILHPKAEIHVLKKNLGNPLPERYIPSIAKARKELDLDIWTDLTSSILKTAQVYKSKI